jgi:hypothetical protein
MNASQATKIWLNYYRAHSKGNIISDISIRILIIKTYFQSTLFCSMSMRK